MKKSIISITLFSMLFILGACSTEPSTGGSDPILPAGVTSLGDTTLDEGLKDAFEKMGNPSIQGMTQWEARLEGNEEQGSCKVVVTQFISEDRFVLVSLRSYDGIYGEEQLDNELVENATAIGSLKISSIPADFSLTDGEGVAISVKDHGYMKLYSFTTEKGARKSKQTPPWTWQDFTESELSVEYYIEKKTSTTLSLIGLTKQSGNAYTMGPDWEYAMQNWATSYVKK